MILWTSLDLLEGVVGLSNDPDLFCLWTKLLALRFILLKLLATSDGAVILTASWYEKDEYYIITY